MHFFHNGMHLPWKKKQKNKKTSNQRRYFDVEITVEILTSIFRHRNILTVFNAFSTSKFGAISSFNRKCPLGNFLNQGTYELLIICFKLCPFITCSEIRRICSYLDLFWCRRFALQSDLVLTAKSCDNTVRSGVK